MMFFGSNIIVLSLSVVAAVLCSTFVIRSSMAMVVLQPELAEFYQKITSKSSLQIEVDLDHSLFQKALGDIFSIESGATGQTIEQHGPWDLLHLKGGAELQLDDAIQIRYDSNQNQESSSSRTSLLKNMLLEGGRTNQELPNITCPSPDNSWIEQISFDTFQLSSERSSIACTFHHLRSGYNQNTAKDRSGSTNRVVFTGSQAVMVSIALNETEPLSTGNGTEATTLPSWNCLYTTMIVPAAPSMGNRALYTPRNMSEEFPSFFTSQVRYKQKDKKEAMDLCVKEALTKAFFPKFPWCSMAIHASYFVERNSRQQQITSDTSTAAIRSEEGDEAAATSGSCRGGDAALSSYVTAAGRRQGDGSCSINPDESQQAFETNDHIHALTEYSQDFLNEYLELLRALPVPRLLEKVSEKSSSATEKQFEDEFNNLSTITLVTAVSVLAVGVIMEMALVLSHCYDSCHSNTKLKTTWKDYMLWILAILEFIAGSIPTFFIFIQNGKPGTLMVADPYVGQMFGKASTEFQPLLNNTQHFHFCFGNVVDIEVVETGVPSWFFTSTVILLVIWCVAQMAHLSQFLGCCVWMKHKATTVFAKHNTISLPVVNDGEDIPVTPMIMDKNDKIPTPEPVATSHKVARTTLLTVESDSFAISSSNDPSVVVETPIPIVTTSLAEDGSPPTPSIGPL